MNPNETKQRPRRDAFIAARLSHPSWSLRKLAESLGISLTTAKRYSRDPKVRDAIDEEIEEALEMARIARRKAIEKLISHIDSQRAGISLQACKLILADVLEPRSKESPPGRTIPQSLSEIAASLNEKEWNQVYEKAGEVKEE